MFNNIKETYSSYLSSSSDLGVLGSFYHYLTLGSSPNLEPQSSEPPVEDPLDIREQSIYRLDESPTISGQAPPRCFTSATDLFRLIDASNASAFTLPQSGHDDDFTAIQTAKAAVEECQIGGLFEESKFLMLESLQELIKVVDHF